jgi:hypothetical protein
MVLSRMPTDEERQIVEEHARHGNETALRELVWALINGPEFSFRH